MPLSGEHEPSSVDWVRKQVEQVERTGTTEGVLVLDRPIVVMTMRGARSGKLRKVPVMRVEHDGAYAVVASKGGAPEHPAWYRNLVEGPQIELQDGTVTQDMTVRQLSGDERAQWWERAVAAFPPYADYQVKTDREIPVLVAEPGWR